MEESLQNDSTEIPRPEKEPKKLFHTYLRNQNKLYVNFFNMIDRKSAIMIRINSTIFPISVFLYNFIKEIQFGSVIGATLIITSFVSLLFALKASRPFNGLIFQKNDINQKLEESIFAVGMTPKSSLKQYENAYEKLMKSESLQLSNQVQAMYKFEQYIKRSFQQLELSYVSFLLGFGIIVILFLFGRF